MKRRVGAVLVREKRIVSTGYVFILPVWPSMSVFINPNSGITERLDGLRTVMKVDVGSATAHYHLTRIESAFVFMQKKMPSRKQAESELESVLYYIATRGCLTSTREPALMARCSCPCERCTIKIIQSGVKEVVYNLEYKV